MFTDNKKRVFLAGMLFAGLVLASSNAGGAIARQAPAVPTFQAPTVIGALHHDVSSPLATLAATVPSGPAVSSSEVQEHPRFPRARHDNAPASAQLPSAVAARVPAVGVASDADSIESPLVLGGPLVNVDGIARTDHPANMFLPPDTTGAIGPTFYLQLVNVTFAVFDRNGTRVFGPLPQATIWSGFGGPDRACETTEGGDSVTLFDRYANRFLFTKLAYPNGIARGPFFQCFAVSVTADPRGPWNRYMFKISDTKFNDYPKFGVWPDGYYMTINQFANVGTPMERLAGMGVGVFERDQMVLGRDARLIMFDLETFDVTIANGLPADLEGPILPPAGSPNWLVALKNLLLQDMESTVPLPIAQVFAVHVDWANPALSAIALTQEIPTLDFNPIFDPGGCTDATVPYPTRCIPQPPIVPPPPPPENPMQRLDALQDRLMFRLQYRNFGDHEALVTNHTVNVAPAGTANRAGIHWFQLSAPAGSPIWLLKQDGIFTASDGLSRWMGSIAMDEAENIALGYSVSSPTVFPGVRYTGRQSLDPPGTMPRQERTLVVGTGSQSHPAGRWGDYSTMVIDPLDDCTFWYTQEYLKVTSRANWATRIGSFQFDTCGLRNTR